MYSLIQAKLIQPSHKWLGFAIVTIAKTGGLYREDDNGLT